MPTPSSRSRIVEMGGEAQSHGAESFCECCETQRAVFDGLCGECAHPDDVALWASDPGEEYL